MYRQQTVYIGFGTISWFPGFHWGPWDTSSADKGELLYDPFMEKKKGTVTACEEDTDLTEDFKVAIMNMFTELKERKRDLKST